MVGLIPDLSHHHTDVSTTALLMLRVADPILTTVERMLYISGLVEVHNTSKVRATKAFVCHISGQ